MIQSNMVLKKRVSDLNAQIIENDLSTREKIWLVVI